MSASFERSKDVDKLTHLGRNILSTESNVNIHIDKSESGIDSL